MSRRTAPPAPAKALEAQNALLREQTALMRQAIEQRKQQLTNSLSQLAVQMGVGRQDNITSMTPLFTSSIWYPLTINWTLLSYMYKTHGILQTAIDEPVDDAFRDGLDLQSKQLQAEDLSELEDFMEEAGIWETLKQAIKWARLFGGAGLVINAGQDPEAPLDERDIKRGRLEFYDADRWELSAPSRYSERFTFHDQPLDASRVITVSGKRAPRLYRVQLAGWGMSEIERMVEDFNLFLRGRNVLYEILDEAKVDVYQIAGYRATLATPDGTARIRQGIQATNELKNFNNALILDADDKYNVQTTTFTGLAEVMKENRIGIASAVRMPLTKLFGIGAQGFNSGEDDIESYNGMVMSTIREPARPLIRKVLRLCMLAVFQREYEFSFYYKPLRVLGAVDEEAVKKSKHDRIMGWYEKSLISSREAAEWAHKEALIPIETDALAGKLPDHPVTETAAAMFVPGQGGEDGDAPPAGKDAQIAKGAPDKKPRDAPAGKGAEGAKEAPDARENARREHHG